MSMTIGMEGFETLLSSPPFSTVEQTGKKELSKWKVTAKDCHVETAHCSHFLQLDAESFSDSLGQSAGFYRN